MTRLPRAGSSWPRIAASQKRRFGFLPFVVLALTAAAFLVVPAGAGAANGLVGAYSFDAGSGSTLADASGSNNAGATTSTSWSTSGRYGGALSFNGSSSWVTIPDSASLDLTSAMTLEGWVKPTGGLASHWSTVLFKEMPGNLTYGLLASSDTSRPAAISTIGTIEKTAKGSSTLPLKTWTFLTASYNGSVVTLYVNGVAVSTAAATGSMPVSSGPLRIGGNSIWGEYFSGLIDNVRVYNRALSAGEIQTDMNTPVTVNAADTQAPSVPTGLAVTGATSTSVTLGWNASTDNVGVTGYGVYWNGVFAGSTAASPYTVSGLSCGTTYSFGVDAADAAANHSAQVSLSASTAACPDTQAPSTPSGLAATGSTGTSVSLAWNASTDNVGVAGYGTYNAGTLAGSGSSTSYTVSGLACGTSYAFAVDAVDAAGNRSAKANLSASTSACPDTQAPSTPSGLAATSSTGTSVSLAWNASTDNVGVAGYGTYNAGTLAGSGSSTSDTVSGLSCGTSYAFAVDAVDAAGNRSAKANLSASTSACPDTQAPSTPGGLAATSSTGTSVSLAWNASTDNVGVSGYGTYKAGVLAGSGSSTSYTVSGLACGTSYAFAVDAFDGAGNRSAKANLSASTSACGDTQAPTAPTGVTANSVSQTSVTLGWNASTDNVGVSGYGTYKAGVLAGSGTARSYTVSGLTCGTSYAFAVDAVDAAGNRSAKTPLTVTTSACATSGSSANLWLSTSSGGSCTRSLSPTGFSQSASCASASAAFATCQPGDVIGVQAGSYGSQSVSGAKVAPGCVMDMGITGTQASFSSINVASSTAYFEIKNGHTGYGWNFNTMPVPNHITFRNIDTTALVFMKGGSNISIIGGSIHSFNAGSNATSLWLEGNVGTNGSTISNVLVDGVDFHDITNSVSGNHFEVIRIDENASFITVRNSKFRNNSPNTATIFITNINTDPGDPHDVTIENNFFGATPSAYYAISTQTPVIQTCTNIKIRYNSFALSPLITACTSGSGSEFKGNVGPRSSGSCPSAFAFSFNVWQWNTNSPCASSDKVVIGSQYGTDKLGFTNSGIGDMHLLTGSAAINAGDPGSYPAADIDGRSRPQGGAPDAGGNEAG